MRHIIITKIVKNNSIQNKHLRNRTDLNPLLKTYVHRTTTYSDKSNSLWWNVLSESEKLEIEIFYGDSHLRKFEKQN